jgi:hypothetical protein
MTFTFTFALTLASLVGCSSTSPNEISGTIHGQTFDIQQAVSAIVQTTVAGTPATIGAVLLANDPNLCFDLNLNRILGGFQGVLIEAYVDTTPVEAPAAGTFTIGATTGNVASAQAIALDDDCHPGSGDEPTATSGTVTLTAVYTNDEFVVGSFDLSLEGGDHITGTFDQPTACTSVSNYVNMDNTRCVGS